MLMKKIGRRAKNQESRRRQRQSGLQKTELQYLQLGARHCDVGLTLLHRRRRGWQSL